VAVKYSLDPFDKCGPDCVAEKPVLDTADGREHDECPDPDASVDVYGEICQRCKFHKDEHLETEGSVYEAGVEVPSLWHICPIFSFEMPK
jgi:hypothetical protein